MANLFPHAHMRGAKPLHQNGGRQRLCVRLYDVSFLESIHPYQDILDLASQLEMDAGQMEMDAGPAMGSDLLVESVLESSKYIYFQHFANCFSHLITFWSLFFVFVVLPLIIFFGNKNRAK